MDRYIEQLLEDLRMSAASACFPEQGQDRMGFSWFSMEEEERTAPERRLEDWTGLSHLQLPPEDRLRDDQVVALVGALKELLEAYNCLFVLQIDVPLRIQYETIRQNFDQTVKVKTCHMGFFELCRPGTPAGTCTLGPYCHCVLFDEWFGHLERKSAAQEEERRRKLQREIEYLQRKYGSRWMKYYPYHLDPDYDDTPGDPYNYGFDDDDDDDDDD